MFLYKVTHALQPGATTDADNNLASPSKSSELDVAAGIRTASARRDIVRCPSSRCQDLFTSTSRLTVNILVGLVFGHRHAALGPWSALVGFCSEPGGC